VTIPLNGRVESGRRRTSGAPGPERHGLTADVAGAPGTARIAVDLLGGDQAPAVVVDGALRACLADPSLHLLLVGPAEAAETISDALADPSRVSVLPIDGGTETARAAVRAVAHHRADAVVSAGDTGTLVLAAAPALGRRPGVRRPPLAAVLPSAAGPIVLLDVGSSVDPDAQTLAMHALLGAAYASVVHGIEAPRVGLLTIGTERGKGDRLRRAAPELFERLAPVAGARYVGLVEGNDVVTGGVADVVVTDGFTGNVLLKGLETAYALVGAPGPATPGPRAAALLGIGGTVVVCHGSARGVDIAAGIALAASLHRRGAVPVIDQLIQGTEKPRVQEVVHEQ
jgi:phosphate acyltransferase